MLEIDEKLFILIKLELIFVGILKFKLRIFGVGGFMLNNHLDTVMYMYSLAY